MHSMQKRRPSAPQRALVFQGGGSLGAYEAGVFHVLYHWIRKDSSEYENIFDIIAGTSIGAINASIIMNHFLDNKSEDNTSKEESPRGVLKYWEGSPERLLDFWKKISSNSILDYPLHLLKKTWGFYKNLSAQMFPYYKSFIDLTISGESLRRYYSTKKRIVFGEPHVFSPLFLPPFPTPLFNKFFDYFPSAWWYQYSNQPLKEFILEFASKLHFDHHETGGIKTDINRSEPRLLLVAANIKTAQPETFDSYSENDITINHVLASAAIPINYSYIEINGNKYWDGGILSNTPVRELISSHRTFWKKNDDNFGDEYEDGYSADSEGKLTFDRRELAFPSLMTNVPLNTRPCGSAIASLKRKPRWPRSGSLTDVRFPAHQERIPPSAMKSSTAPSACIVNPPIKSPSYTCSWVPVTGS